ncbi:MAG: creatininase family protein [Thermoproteota archaeon]
MGEVRVWLLPGSRYDSAEKSVAVLPVGSLERHGDHLPLGTDTILADHVARRVAERLGAHLFPPVWYGSSRGLRRFPGTIDVDDDAFEKYVASVLEEIVRNGYRFVLVINGHGGNSATLRRAAKRVAYRTGAVIVVVDWWRDVAQEERKRLFSSPGHAGEDETSAVLHVVPEAVDMAAASDYIPPDLPRINVYSPTVDEKLYPRAVMGSPSRASADKGRAWLEAVVSEIVEVFEKVKRLLVGPGGFEPPTTRL